MTEGVFGGFGFGVQEGPRHSSEGVGSHRLYRSTNFCGTLLVAALVAAAA